MARGQCHPGMRALVEDPLDPDDIHDPEEGQNGVRPCRVFRGRMAFRHMHRLHLTNRKRRNPDPSWTPRPGWCRARDSDGRSPGSRVIGIPAQPSQPRCSPTVERFGLRPVAFNAPEPNRLQLRGQPRNRAFRAPDRVPIFTLSRICEAGNHREWIMFPDLPPVKPIQSRPRKFGHCVKLSSIASKDIEQYAQKMVSAIPMAA